MKDEHMLLLLNYLDGKLSEDEENRLRELVTQGVVQQDELQQLREFYQRTGEYPTPEPTERLRSHFYESLGQEQVKLEGKKKRNSWFPYVQFDIKLSQLAYGLIIFLLGISIGMLSDTGHEYERQLADMKVELQVMQENLVVNLLEQPSATQRLKAVSISTDMRQTNDKVVTSLLRVLNEDSHVNVRLAALDALLYYADLPQVRAGLIRSIAQQEAPMVQIALATAMVELEERRSLEELKKLLEKKDINEMVEQEVRKSILVLS